ncbi:GIY-YIG nuclease family protein [Inquilinus sp. Marseille-Q2685]|uniref:GIY-YIG nuclease family protein n=1 Tax=Inquilinus sp. Marseille-Q2685 TaxID=2866581 RepID=UPI001CE3C70D|nr:GIY-YIG nuclease family protein [Inquilinus sp. Marseille-Q2685]
MILDDHIGDLNFTPPHDVLNRPSIADLFRKSRRCGIYIIEFQNDELYVGKTSDVARRYGQHRKIHQDIRAIRFQKLKKSELDQSERSLIYRLERAGFGLRNVTFTSIPQPGSDFEGIMPIDQQTLWLDKMLKEDRRVDRAQDSTIDARSLRSFDRLQKACTIDPHLSFLRYYIDNLIPSPRSSEISFWSLTALGGGTKEWPGVLYRLNMFWQEVMSVSGDGEDAEIWIRCARSPLEAAPGGLSQVARRIDAEPYDFHYEPGGSDQISLHAFWNDDPLRILRDEDVARSIRLFNLRLMNKGPTNFSRSHCYALVTAAYEAPDPETREALFWSRFRKPRDRR